MQDATCKMLHARCYMQDVTCKMLHARCKKYDASIVPYSFV